MDLVQELESSNYQDDLVFTKLINKVMRVLGVRDVARHFTTSITTINRWISGKSHPHSSLRLIIIEHIILLVKEKRKET